MNQRLQAIGSAAISTAALITTTAMGTVNLFVMLIGISSLPKDVPSSFQGLIELAIIVASWPTWALLIVLFGFSCGFFIQIYRVTTYIKAAEAVPDKLQTLENAIDQIRSGSGAQAQHLERRIQGVRDEVAAIVLRMEETRHLADEADKLMADISPLMPENWFTVQNLDWERIKDCENIYGRRIDEISKKLTISLRGPWMKGHALPSHSPSIQPNAQITTQDIDEYKKFANKFSLFRFMRDELHRQRVAGLR